MWRSQTKLQTLWKLWGQVQWISGIFQDSKDTVKNKAKGRKSDSNSKIRRLYPLTKSHPHGTSFCRKPRISLFPLLLSRNLQPTSRTLQIATLEPSYPPSLRIRTLYPSRHRRPGRNQQITRSIRRANPPPTVRSIPIPKSSPRNAAFYPRLPWKQP